MIDFPALLADHLRGEASLEDAVAGLIGGVRSADDLWPRWEAVVGAAARADDHARLVAFVVAVRGSGRTDGLVVWGSPVRDWAELPVFGAVMREAWNRQETPAGVQAWGRLNVFAARLTAAGVDFLRYALWTLREAFEETPDVPPALLPAADAWFGICGALIDEACAGEVDPGHAWLGSAALEAGLTRPAFTAGRLAFWQERRAGQHILAGP